VGNTGHQQAVHSQDRSQQIKPAQQKAGKQPGRCGARGRKRPRLRPVDLSQDPVGVTAQDCLRLLAEPRTEHRERTRKKRDSGDCQARIYLGSPSVAIRRWRRWRIVMVVCKGSGAHQEHQAQHQGGGLPLLSHGFSCSSGSCAVFATLNHAGHAAWRRNLAGLPVLRFRARNTVPG
jgi:hypothetical protein